MNKIYFILLLLAFLIGTSWLLSCQTGDDEDDNDVDSDDDDNDSGDDDDSNETPDPECDDTHLSQLLGISLKVNGNYVEMPAQVKTTDELILEMEYADEDCNLEGGRIRISPDQLDPQLFALDEYLHHTYKIGPEIGCSSDKEGKPYSLELDPNEYLLPENLERTLPMDLRLSDRCHFACVPDYLPLDFTVVED